MKYVFIIDDPTYGGHIKSFLAQFKSLKLNKNYLILLPKYSYIYKNIEKYHFINKNNIVLYNPKGLNKLFFSIDLYNKLLLNINNEEDTIIHSYSQRCYFSCAFANIKFKKTKFISSVMGGPIPFPFYKSANLHIGVSTEQINRSKLDTKNYVMIANRIELKEKLDSNLSYEERLKTKTDVLFITRFDEDKRVPIVNAINTLHELSKKYNIKIIGDGEIKEEMQNLFLEKIDKDKIEFLGFHKNPIEYCNQTAIVTGMGRSILEFMLKGVPSILIGFNSTMELFTLRNVKKAFDYNFSGRNEEENKVLLYDTNFEEIDIYDFLYEQYSVNLFKDKYNNLVKNLNNEKSSTLSIILEYLSFNMNRIMNKFKR